MPGRRVSLLVGTAIAMASTAYPLWAQAQDATDQSSNSEVKGLQEVVVTAEKQATGRSVQKVPIAITALDAETMAEQHIESLSDVGHLAPGVTLDQMGTLPGSAGFEIRGISLRSSSSSIDLPNAVMQDGMPLTLQNGVTYLGTFDTQSVEVLRGPQGVLQGVNAAGGAVTFTTPLPSSTFHASGSFTFGNFDEVKASGVVEGPLDDIISAKIAVAETHIDGYYNNTTGQGTYKVAPGNPSGVAPQYPTGLIGGTQSVVVKPTFLIEPNEDMKIKIFAQFEDDIMGGSSPIAINPNPAPGPASKFLTVFGYTPSVQPYQIAIATPGFSHNSEEHVIGEFDWNVAGGSWTTIASFRNVNYNALYNAAGSPFNINLNTQTEQNRQFNIDSHFNGQLTEDLKYLAGVYLFYDNLPTRYIASTNLAELGKPLAVPSNPNSPLNMNNQFVDYNQRTKSAATYGNLDYSITQDLTLSVGARYQYESKDLHIDPGTTNSGVVYCTTGTLNNCPNTYYDTSKAWYTLTPRSVLSWQATSDLMAYFNYSKGWSAGNYNAPQASTVVAVLTPVNPQTVDSFEVGVKGQWFDRRFRTNLALYDQQFDNIQKTAISSINGIHVTTLLNAAKADIKGVEAELTAMPIEGLRLNASAGYVMASYSQFDVSLPTNAYAPGYVGTNLAFQLVPKWTTDVGASYSFELPRFAGDFDINTDYSWRSMQYGDFYNTPQVIVKPYGLLNASLNYTAGEMTYSLWGQNLQNTFYSLSSSINAGWIENPGIPRTFGMTVSFKL